MVTIAPIEGSYGAEITDVDLSAATDDVTIAAIVGALHEYRMVVIRDQSLTPDAYLRFGREFGAPHPHVLDHLRMDGYPAIMAVGNTEPQHRDGANRNGAAFWHTDQSYEAEPASATMLHAIKTPESGGETLIADMAGAYDALADETKARIDGLTARHLYGAASGVGEETIAAPLRTKDQVEAVPAVPHALVRPHPVTGRKALYAVAGTPFDIDGMDQTEAARLLQDLKVHATSAPFVYKHRYRVGDVAIWDTMATLHAATPIGVATGEKDSRLLHRISVKGRPRVCH
jgi:taurine dioxygenase